MVWVALAGPATNIALALLAASAFHVLTFVPVNAAQWVADNLKKCVRDQCRSGGLQYASDPPLDGGRVAVGLLPNALALTRCRGWSRTGC